MTMKTCIGCGRGIPRNRTRCDTCPQPRWRRQGSTRAWRVQRQRVLERDGYQCTYISNGQRCQVRSQLAVHHLIGGNVMHVPDELLATVCRQHHPNSNY
jgi:5-methylcytosine-specific restriction endonuclease McrA